jgi:hypothetical protein
VHPVVSDQLREALMLTHDVGGLAGVGVERRLRHLRAEFFKALLKQSDVGEAVHQGSESEGERESEGRREKGIKGMREEGVRD